MSMYRYVTLIWNQTNREAIKVSEFITTQLAQASRHVWRSALSTDGMIILDSSQQKGRMQTYHLSNDGGAILGSLFHNNFTKQVEDLDSNQSQSCLDSKSEFLVHNFWGRYVAFLNHKASGKRYVMRDPSGAFPCFFTSYRGVDIYFSDIQDVADLCFLPFSVNLDYVKTNILLPQFQKTHTGLKEVSEVLPAECIEISPFDRQSRFVWDPTEVSQTNVIDDPAEAASSIRSTVMNTIGALSGSYNRVLHNLGGLDSSIVLASLAQAPKRPEIVCLTHYTKTPRGDERFYSRQVSEKYGISLVEAELDYRKADLRKIFNSNKLTSPLGFFDCIGLTGNTHALVKNSGAEAIFYGVGGDNVFYQPARNLSALDYVRKHGLLSKHSVRVAIEASRYGRKSLYSTFREMWREKHNPAPCNEFVLKSFFENAQNPLINSEFLGSGGHEKHLHPLLIPQDNSPKGKQMHILMCALFSIEHYDCLDLEYLAPRIHVFLTQPIVELCLRIPTWILTYHGLERGLARQAFRNDLPLDILRRFSKSTPVDYYNDLYDHNIDLIREYLLEGILTQEGILNRKTLETSLNHDGPIAKIIKYKTIGLLGTEAWLRSWDERKTTVGAMEIAM